jgi:hypothetical protein
VDCAEGVVSGGDASLFCTAIVPIRRSRENAERRRGFGACANTDRDTPGSVPVRTLDLVQ